MSASPDESPYLVRRCKDGTCDRHPRYGGPVPTGWRGLRVRVRFESPVFLDVPSVLFDPAALAFYLGQWHGGLTLHVERCDLGYIGYQVVLENNDGERRQVGCSAMHDHFKAGMLEHRGWVNP